ncbi:hypothetical protein ACFS4T_04765 [Pseudomonas lini]
MEREFRGFGLLLQTDSETTGGRYRVPRFHPAMPAKALVPYRASR